MNNTQLNLGEEEQKKVLVIGAAGFVGRHLLKYLSDIPNLTLFSTKLTNETIDSTEFPNIDVNDLNITSESEIRSLLDKIQPDYIILLAAQSSVALSFEKPALTLSINTVGSVNVMDAIKNVCPQSTLLLVGSSEQYGHVTPDQLPVNEKTRLDPISPYAISKAASENMASVYVKSKQMKIIMVRAFNHIGPGQAAHFVVSDFARQIAVIEATRAEPVIRVGNLSARRDFTDVRDIVRGYYQLLQLGHAGEVYNIGSGKSVSIQYILDTLLSYSKLQIDIVVDTLKMRSIEIPEIYADITKLQKDTKWERMIPLDKSLLDSLNYWRNQI